MRIASGFGVRHYFIFVCFALKCLTPKQTTCRLPVLSVSDAGANNHYNPSVGENVYPSAVRRLTVKSKLSAENASPANPALFATSSVRLK